MSNQPSKLTGCLTRIGSVYTFIAIITFTTIILIFGIEFSLGVIRNIRQSDAAVSCQHYAGCDSKRASLPYYQAQDWGEEFWDTAIPKARLQPYTMWHTEDHEDKFATFKEGFRVTPNAQCTEDAYDIYIFGGSTIWGEGAPDWGTIPAYLQDLFNNQTDEIVCVHNMGQRQFHLTQEIVELINQLQLGTRPDMVIFYDGINEVGNTIETGVPWIPGGWSWDTPAKEDPIKQIIAGSNINRLLNRFRKSTSTSAIQPFSDIELDNVIAETVDVYLNNYQIVEGLSQQFDFEVYFFWQPFLGVDDKVLTVEEKDILAVDLAIAGPGYFEDPLKYIQDVYAEIKTRAEDISNLYYISDILDEYEQQIYFDIWHITPEGNEIVAQRIFDIIEAK